jgi:pyruvate/2-oxoglutarate dehydrogenase complex dihydrolipoamide acyltransferase (E2) component
LESILKETEMPDYIQGAAPADGVVVEKPAADATPAKPAKAAKAAKAAKVDADQKPAADATPETYVLEKNFGSIVNGVHKFWEAGKEFIATEEADLISFFHRAGASIKLKD